MDIEKMFYEAKPFLYGAFGAYALYSYSRLMPIWLFSGMLLWCAYMVIRKRHECRQEIK